MILNSEKVFHHFLGPPHHPHDLSYITANPSDVSYGVVLRDKKEGGLGIGSLMLKNRAALLFKWIWRLSSPRKSIIGNSNKPVFENG